MKLGWAVVLTVLLGGLLAAPTAAAYPPWQGTLMNDYEGRLTSSERAYVEEHLVWFAQETSVEIAVALVNHTEGEDLELYALHLFEHWGIGKKDHHNGLLFLVVTSTRQVRIEVGYGLEHLVNSFHAHRIITEIMVPRLDQGDYFGALDEGIGDAQGLILEDPKYALMGPAPDPPLPVWDLYTFHFLALVFGAMLVLNAGPLHVVRGAGGIAQIATVGVAAYFAFTTAPWWFPLAVLGGVPLSYLVAFLGYFGLMLIGGRGGGGFSLGGGRSGGGGGSGRW